MAESPEAARSARPCAPASHAKRLLGIDPRTARKRIRAGLLPGFTAGKNYFFYTGDQPAGSRGAAAGDGAKDTVEELQEQLDAANEARSELQTQLTFTAAKLASAEEAKRVLLAANSLTIEAAKKIRDGSDDLLKVVELQRDLLAEFVTPDGLQDLPPQQP